MEVVKVTHRPAWKRPHVPFLLKVQQHFAVELILVQQRFDPVGVVLQVLQQHLQIPAQTATTEHVHKRCRHNHICYLNP